MLLDASEGVGAQGDGALVIRVVTGRSKKEQPGRLTAREILKKLPGTVRA